MTNQQKATTMTEPINITRIEAATLRVPIVGTSPVIPHRMSEKARKIMLDNMQGVKAPKQHKDPEAEYEACFYHIKGGGTGLPAAGFKQATIGGARHFGKAVTMTSLRGMLFVKGELGVGPDALDLVRLEGPDGGEPEAVMREDVVTVGRGGTDLRYRPMFAEWRTLLEVVYTPASITRDSILSLIDAGGFAVGVGDWRPEKNGSFGTYTIDPTRDIEEIAR